MSILYTVLLLLSAGTCLAAIQMTLRYRQTKGAIAFVAYLFFLFIWSLTYAVHWWVKEPTAKHFWLNMTYFGVVFIPISYFVFALRFTNKDTWLTRSVLALFMIEPIVTLILVWTDPWHGWFFAGKHELAMSTIFDGSALFWFHVVYSYGMLLVVTLILLNAVFRSLLFYRWQLSLVLAGLLLPWIVNILSVLKLTPWPDLDATPIAFTLTALAISYARLGWRFLDIVPVARELLIDNMDDGLLVLDPQNRILDFNAEARKLFVSPNDLVIGKPVASISSRWPEIVEKFLEVKENDVDIELNLNNSLFFHLISKRIFDKRNIFLGRLVTWRDITDRKQVEFDLQEANLSLQNRLREIEKLQQELREQAIRDPLTGLYNRRFLQEVLEKEFLRIRRNQSSLVVVIMDIDHFKLVNDRFGHLGGDHVLQELSDLLKDNLRAGDILCRYGGEELVVVMSGIDLRSAKRRVEGLREEIETMQFTFPKGEMRITVSIGLAIAPLHAESVEGLLRAADDALYEAKAQGKNRVVVYTDKTDRRYIAKTN